MHSLSPALFHFQPERYRTLIVTVGCLGAFSFLTARFVVDLDIWHEMSLAREVFTLGHMPWTDSASYMPTLEPVVHHEWGAGVVAYVVATTFGVTGLAILRWCLTWGLAIVVWRSVRSRGVSIEILSFVVPLASYVINPSFSPIRAQMYSFVFLAIMLDWLSRGKMEEGWRWGCMWLAIYVLWINTHGGCLVGAGLFFLYWLERLMRGLPHRRLFCIGLAMAPLFLLTPYGLHYVDYLFGAVRLNRTYINEWQPIWATDQPLEQLALAISVVILAYAVYYRGIRKTLGISLVLATLAEAVLSKRMASLYIITWMMFVPEWLSDSELEKMFGRAWNKFPGFLSACWVYAATLPWIYLLYKGPLLLTVPGVVPVDPSTYRGYPTVYPIGAVAYLREANVPTKLIVPFDVGAYVHWKLPKLVNVSIDSRYEAAYPPKLADEHFQLYSTMPGWQATLKSYSNSDAILIPSWSRLHAVIDSVPDWPWRRTYHDVSYSIYAKEGHPLPVQDELAAIPEDTIP